MSHYMAQVLAYAAQADAYSAQVEMAKHHVEAFRRAYPQYADVFQEVKPVEKISMPYRQLFSIYEVENGFLAEIHITAGAKRLAVGMTLSECTEAAQRVCADLKLHEEQNQPAEDTLVSALGQQAARVNKAMMAGMTPPAPPTLRGLSDVMDEYKKGMLDGANLKKDVVVNAYSNPLLNPTPVIATGETLTLTQRVKQKLGL